MLKLAKFRGRHVFAYYYYYFFFPLPAINASMVMKEFNLGLSPRGNVSFLAFLRPSPSPLLFFSFFFFWNNSYTTADEFAGAFVTRCLSNLCKWIGSYIKASEQNERKQLFFNVVNIHECPTRSFFTPLPLSLFPILVDLVRDRSSLDLKEIKRNSLRNYWLWLEVLKKEIC